MVGESWEISGNLMGKLLIFITLFGVIFPTILPLADHFFPTKFPQNSGERQILFSLSRSYQQMDLVKN